MAKKRAVRMMDKSQAIQSFWEQFDIPVYDENSVHDEEDRIKDYGAAFPYLTYDIVLSDFEHEVAMSANLWYRSTSWKNITAKVNEIEDYFNRGGKIIHFEGGGIWIKKGTPFAQRLGGAEDAKIKRMLINISAEYISNQ